MMSRKLTKAALRRLWRLTRATSIVVGLAVMLALVAGVASLAVAKKGEPLLLGIENTASAVTTLINNASGPALDLQVGSGNAPLTVNSDTKVDNLNADKLDGKDSTWFSRVGLMSTIDWTEIPQGVDTVTYGTPLSITAPAAGFVRVNGNVSVFNNGSLCTSDCIVIARVRHIESGSLSDESLQDMPKAYYGNVGLDWVFPVNAGVNTFDIQLRRGSGDGQLLAYHGVLTGEYTPFGPTGGSTLSA